MATVVPLSNKSINSIESYIDSLTPQDDNDGYSHNYGYICHYNACNLLKLMHIQPGEVLKAEEVYRLSKEELGNPKSWPEAFKAAKDLGYRPLTRLEVFALHFSTERNQDWGNLTYVPVAIHPLKVIWHEEGRVLREGKSWFTRLLNLFGIYQTKKKSIDTVWPSVLGLRINVRSVQLCAVQVGLETFKDPDLEIFFAKITPDDPLSVIEVDAID
jgi:hypothetical protein